MQPFNSVAFLDRPTLINSPTASHRLYIGGLVTLTLTCLWFINKNAWEFDTQTILGIGIAIVASRPALAWAKRNYLWLPAFEIAMLTCIPFYAIPLLEHHQELRYYSETSILYSGILVILYILVSSVAFSLVKRIPKPRPTLARSLIPRSAYRWVPLGVTISNIYLALTTFTDLLSSIQGRIADSFFMGIALLSIFISSRLLGGGLMSPPQKISFITNIIIQIIFNLLSLLLIQPLMIIGVTLTSFSMARRSIPWVAVLVILPLFSILHLGKGQMREIYWEKGKNHASDQEVKDIPIFFSEWIRYGLQVQNRSDISLEKKESLFNRASLIHILCMCTDRIPKEKPYLNGESYTQILSAVVPRILWKNKPSTLFAADQLAIYFDLMSSDSVGSVAIAFGMLAEAYVNFGPLGVIGLGIIWGLISKKISLASRDAPQFSAFGILAILFTSWSFQIEQSAATWVSSFSQGCILCIGLPLAYRKLTSS